MPTHSLRERKVSAMVPEPSRLKKTESATNLLRRRSGTISLTTTHVNGPGPSEKKNMTRHSESVPAAVDQPSRNLSAIVKTSMLTSRLTKSVCFPALRR